MRSLKRLFSEIKRLGLFLKYTGLWIPIPLYLLICISYVYLTSDEISTGWILLILGLCHLPALYVWGMNTIAISNGFSREELPLFPTNISTNEMYLPSDRGRYLHKSPSKELIKDRPEGIIFGMTKGRYVAVDPCAFGSTSTLVIGGSGSGKTSSVLLDFLISNSQEEQEASVIMIDVKGELEQKGFFKEGKLAVFNPRDRYRHGFDFFYDLSDTSSEDEILTTMRRVVYSLIPKKASIPDPFWVDAPRQVLLGLFLYGWEEKNIDNLPDLADFASSKNLKTLINEILADVEEDSVISKDLVAFGGKDSADETLSSIAMNIGNALDLLKTDENLRYLLREADQKITPLMVEEGISLDFQISDEFLEQYACILNLCLATCNAALTRRPEGVKRKVVCLYDELGRICGSSGELAGLQQILQIGRSRGCMAVLALQSWSALDGIYSKGAMQDMLTNLPYRVILNAQPDDQATVDMAVKSFGKYSQKKRSISAGREKSYSYSFEEKDVLVPTDLSRLVLNNEVCLLSPHGAFMLHKCQYFKDPILKKIASSIKKSREEK